MTAAPDPQGHPAWYGAVMGTGALALAVAAQEPAWGGSGLGWRSGALLALASVLALVLLPRSLRRVALIAEADPELIAVLEKMGGGRLLSGPP